MSVRLASLLATIFVLVLGLQPVTNHDGRLELRFPGANAQGLGFADPKVRAEAMKKILAKKIPPGECGSLILLQESYYLSCGADMQPLKRKECEKSYKEITDLNVCTFRERVGAYQSRPELCVALRTDHNEMCVTNVSSEDKADCALNVAAMKKNNCK